MAVDNDKPALEVAAKITPEERAELSRDELEEMYRVLQAGLASEKASTLHINNVIRPPKVARSQLKRKRERLDGSCKRMDDVVAMMEVGEAEKIQVLEAKTAVEVKEKPAKDLLTQLGYMLISAKSVTMDPMKAFAKRNKLSHNMKRDELLQQLLNAIAVKPIGSFVAAAVPAAAVHEPAVPAAAPEHVPAVPTAAAAAAPGI